MHAKTALLLAAALVTSAAGCGSSTTATTATTAKTTTTTAKEKSPPGDIPDSTQFVSFTMPGGGFSVKVPEGWARTGGNSKVTFTSNLNSVTVESGPAAAAATKGQRIHRSGQTAMRLKYLTKGQANAVTGKATPEAVERYTFVHNGKQAVLILSGARGADNVDAWRTVSDSLRWGN
jgi:hypothetical protein